MLQQELRRIFSGAPSRPFKIFVPMVAVALCFCAVCAYLLIEARRAAGDRAGDAAASLATAIESDLVRNIEALNVSLQTVVDNLKQPELDKLSPALRQRLLFERSADARHMGAILVLDETGRLRFDSRKAEPQPQDLSGREYFKVHKAGKASVLYVGRPQFATDSGQFFVGISKRLSHADGSFAGVVSGTMRLDYVQQLFKDVALGTNSTITLSRTDGAALVRWPQADTETIQSTELFERIASSKRGRFETAASDNAAPRQIVYTQISDLPMVLSIGQSLDEIYAPWRHYAWTVGVLLAVLSTLAAALAWFLLRELRRRSKIEQRLATLASTDGLTGLSNRWHFDDTLAFEWRRARRDREPLALVMIDADWFKAYNDGHGHQAGDRVLKALGGAIAGRTRIGTDVGARFGGDEFAVLLPGTSLAGAARVANQIRAKFAEDCEELRAEVGISMGVACLLPEAATDPATLLSAADRALYRAKHDGRNRTELAEGEFAMLLDKVA